jgi:NAD+ synthase (glutamine-hydrolysing)
MKIHLHQTHHTIADFDGIFSYLERHFGTNQEGGLHIFPELFLSGYPLQDLCLQRSFVKTYLNLISRINTWSKGLKSKNEDCCMLIGGINYEFADEQKGIPLRLTNVIYKLIPGKELEPIYAKILLPNYDIFDEKKYFHVGDGPKVLEFNGKKIGLLICEDMWHSNVHKIDPVQDLIQLGVELDVVVNLSASPYTLHKCEKRVDRGITISKAVGAPFIYVNRVGCEDEIIFDGSSFVVNGNIVTHRSKSFADDLSTVELEKFNGPKQKIDYKVENTWESMFSPSISYPKDTLPTLTHLDDAHCEEIVQALCFGLQEYAKKSHFKKFVVALSGGMDSALVVALTKLSLQPGQELECIYMPSEFSRDLSYNLSVDMCKRLNIPLHVLPISSVHNSCRELFGKHINKELAGLADENIQSRLRGLLLYARSNQSDAMVINTSNKSELAVGYSTIYGDSVGAISMLGDLFKSEIFVLSRYINRKYSDMIPEEIITRPPSAELRNDQVDTDSLPPYERLDVILEAILSYRLGLQDLLNLGFDREEIERVINLYRRTEYKRAQFCPILKIKSKSFGFGYRVPICKNSTFYLEEMK